MLKVRLDELLKAINKVAVIATNPMLSDNQRVIMFLVDEGKFYLYAKSTTALMRYELPSESFEYDDSDGEYLLFQVRIKELLALLGTLSADTSEYVEFIRSEYSIEVKTTITSSYGDIQPLNVHLDLINVADLFRDKIKTIPEPEKDVETELLSVYLDYLVPSIDTVEEVLDSSKIGFGKDAVFTLGGSSFTFMESNLDEEFQDIILGRVALTVLKSLFSQVAEVKLLRDDASNSLIVKSDNIVTVVTYKSISDSPSFSNYGKITELAKMPNYIAIDRYEMKKSLERLAIFGGVLQMQIEDLPESKQYVVQVPTDGISQTHMVNHLPYLLTENGDYEHEDTEDLSDVNVEVEELNDETDDLDINLDGVNFDDDNDDFSDEDDEDFNLLDLEQDELEVLSSDEDFSDGDNELSDEDDEETDEIGEFISVNSEPDMYDAKVVREDDVDNDNFESELVDFTVTQELVLKNSRLNQRIPILYSNGVSIKGDSIVIKRLDMLRRAIIGDDTLTSDVLVIGIKPERSGFNLSVHDSYELWYSYFTAER